jgi:hypothetical protein
MKMGDKVKLLDNIYDNDEDSEMAPGRTGIIYDVSTTGSYIGVTLDGEPVEGSLDWTFLPTELEVIE